jgi:Trypsin-like peptidase domain/TPR repeat/Tetratricopeptide repeat
MLARFGLFVLVIVCPFAAAVADSADIPALVQKAKPAVVEIVTLDQQKKILKTGTGFFISPDGVLLTNYHVISGGSSIMAQTPNGAMYVLKSVVATSETYDVAELQFFATDVPCLSLGSSTSAVEGQRVLVIGNPEGLEGTVSDGIISAFRSGRTKIQITAPISPGSSGSPVLDESGSVIGIATQVSKEGQNLNFAISAEAIRDALAKSSNSNPWVLFPAVPTPTATRNSAADYVSRGEQKAGDGNFEGAIADYTEAIRLNPNNAEAFNARGYAYFKLQQYSKAISDNTEAIRLQPNNSMTYVVRSVAYRGLGEYEKAIADCTEAIRLIPINSLAYVFRGNAYCDLGEYGKAISDYTESIRILPGSAPVYESRANAYEKLGKFSMAAEDRKKAKELSGR